jgi:integrase
MSNKTKRPHLILAKASQHSDGRVRAAIWRVVDYLDGKRRFIATGCAAGEAEKADRFLADYIAAKYKLPRRGQDIDAIGVADVLSVYLDDRPLAPGEEHSKQFLHRIDRLIDWWGGKMLAEVTGATCRAYAEVSGNRSGARRDLEDLRAAIVHHRRRGLHRGIVDVILPPKGPPRDRWLTRHEAAQLLWTCWRTRGMQARVHGRWAEVTAPRSVAVPTKRYPLRHLARFILIGLYTGSRCSVIADASPIRQQGRSFVDLDRGIFYRLAIGQVASPTKRQTAAPIPPRLLAYLRRWQRVGIAKEHFVEWNGKAVKSVKTAFAGAIEKAGLKGPIAPHTLRHTAVTWLMQNGAPMWQVAGFVGVSEQMVREVYGHRHPDYVQEAVAASGRRGGKRPAPAASVVSIEEARRQRDKQSA